MTALKKVYFINEEIKRNREAIKDLRRYSVSCDLLNAYEKLIEKQTEELVAAKMEAEKYINNIDDEVARVVAKMRYIDLKTWREIEKRLHYDRTALYRRMDKQIAQITHKK